MSSYLQQYIQSQAENSTNSYAMQQFSERQADVSNAAMIEEKKRAHEPGNEVELCKRVAQIPVAEQLGAEHWWLRTDHKEMGMGPATGGVPGLGRSPDMPLSPTTINDHTGQGADEGSYCVAAGAVDPAWANVDTQCVEREMVLGIQTGRWTPLFNDCQTRASSVLDRCSPPSIEAPNWAASTGTCNDERVVHEQVGQ